MAQAVISHQQSMEMDLNVDTIVLEMVEILSELKKNKDDQLDQNFFQEDHDYKKNKKEGKKSNKQGKNKT